jgi:transcription initiation factor TFIIIB Brf1 subunit/transcription initiation factor TFIIB
MQPGSRVGGGPDAYGDPIPKQTESALRRLQKVQNWYGPRGKTRRIRHADRALEEVAAKLEAPDWALQDARWLHGKLMEHPYVVFHRLDVMAGALLVAVLAAQEWPIVLAEVAARLKVKSKLLARDLRTIRRHVPSMRTGLGPAAFARRLMVQFGRPDLVHRLDARLAPMPAVNRNPLVVAAAACHLELKAAGILDGLQRLVDLAHVPRGAVVNYLRATGFPFEPDGRRRPSHPPGN